MRIRPPQIQRFHSPSTTTEQSDSGFSAREWNKENGTRARIIDILSGHSQGHRCFVPKTRVREKLPDLKIVPNSKPLDSEYTKVIHYVPIIRVKRVKEQKKHSWPQNQCHFCLWHKTSQSLSRKNRPTTEHLEVWHSPHAVVGSWEFPLMPGNSLTS